jgi:hypothetical protein
MLDLGTFQGYSETIVKVFGEKYYGKHRHDGPTKLDASNIPWRHLPTVPEMQKMLRNAMKKIDFNTMPTTGSSEKDLPAAKELVKNLGNADFQGACSVMGLACTELGDLRKSTSTGWPAALHETDMMCDVMPAAGVRELNIEESHEICVLISGVRVWFQCPPTEHNLTVYAKLLESREQKQDKPIDAGDLKNFKGGVVFLQNEGETIEIAPFCPTIMVSTEPSVSANWLIDTAEKVPLRLKYLHISRTEIGKLGAKDKKQAIQRTLLRRHGGLLPDIKVVLGGNIQHLNAPVVQKAIAENWEASKDDIQGMIVASGDKVWTAEKIALMWVSHMIAPTKHRKQACAICDQDFNWNNRPKDDMERRLQKHFLQEHWPVQKAKGKRKSEVESLKTGAPTPTKRTKR